MSETTSYSYLPSHLADNAVEIKSMTAVAMVHGEEPEPGRQIFDLLEKEPIDIYGRTVKGFIANPGAAEDGSRYKDVNLALCMMDPDSYPGTYEASLIPAIDEALREEDLIFDFHSSRGMTRHDIAYVGPCVREYVPAAIALTGIRAVIVSKGGIVGRFPQAVLFDIAPTSPRNDPRYWVPIFRLILQNGLSPVPVESFSFLAQADIPYDEQQAAGVADRVLAESEELKAVANLLGVGPRPVHSLYTYMGECAEVVAPIGHSEISVVQHGVRRALQLPTLRELAISRQTAVKG